jgi:hypothetical protein
MSSNIKHLIQKLVPSSVFDIKGAKGCTNESTVPNEGLYAATHNIVPHRNIQSLQFLLSLKFLLALPRGQSFDFLLLGLFSLIFPLRMC